MKKNDEANKQLMSAHINERVETIVNKIIDLENKITVQDEVMKRQFEEMHNYCKFYTSLYSDLKITLIHTKQLLLSKFSDIHLPSEFTAEGQENEKIKDLREIIAQLKLENMVLKTQLRLNGAGDVEAAADGDVEEDD